MTIYTLESETGNITALPTAEAAATVSQTPFDVFTSQQELAELMANWPADRLLSTYNSLPGVQPLKSLQDPKRAAHKIWQRIAKLGQITKVEAATKAAPPAARKPKATTKATAGAQVAQDAPAPGKAKKQPTVPNAAQKGRKAGKPSSAKTRTRKTPSAKVQPITTPRTGSKMAQVIAMLQRKNGATITEIMREMGWLKHTVRGFMAGTLKKAGYTVESFKPEGGDRTYRLPK
jgi:hypothetical protein